MMRYILILFIFIMCVGFIQTDPPRCTNGLGHVKHRYSYTLRDTTGIETYFDTIGDYEYLIVPQGYDTLVYQCVRCDSIISEVNDTIKIMVREI